MIQQHWCEWNRHYSPAFGHIWPMHFWEIGTALEVFSWDIEWSHKLRIFHLNWRWGFVVGDVGLEQQRWMDIRYWWLLIEPILTIFGHCIYVQSFHDTYPIFLSPVTTLPCNANIWSNTWKELLHLVNLVTSLPGKLLPLSSNSVELSTATLADQKHLLQPPSDVFNVSWRRSIQLGSSEMGRAFNVCGIEIHDQTGTTFDCRHANANPRLKTAPLKFMTLVTERTCAKTRYFE